MGRVHQNIDESLSAFLRQQSMFFVATAPLAADGHVNLSPKGLDSFRILDERTVAYLDLTGSGIETVAHLKENGRIVLLFCAFQGQPRIVRLHGRGEVIDRDSAQFLQLRALFPEITGARCIIRIHCDRVSESCGFAVPQFEFVAQRTQLVEWAQRKGAGLDAYRTEKNCASLDGLPGLVPNTGSGG